MLRKSIRLHSTLYFFTM